MSQSSFTRYSFGADVHTAATGGYVGRNIWVYIEKTDGTPFTGLTFNSSGLIARGFIPAGDGTSAVSSIALSAGTRDTYTEGGFYEVSASGMPGVYQFGVPDAFLAGSQESVIVLSGVALMAPCRLLIDTTAAFEMFDANWGNYSLESFTVNAVGSLVKIGANQTTAPSIRDAVFNANASSYNSAGTMGNKINAGGGGGSNSYFSQPLFRQTLYKGINAQNVYVRVMSKSTGDPATGIAGTLSAQIRKQNIGGALTGAVNLTTNTAVEVGQGVYVFTVSDIECNSDAFVILPSSSNSGVVPFPVLVETVAVNPSVDVASIGGDTSKMLNLANFFSSTGYNAANSTVGHAAVVDSITNITNGILGAALTLRGTRGRATTIGEAIAHIEQMMAGPNKQSPIGKTTYRNDGTTVLLAQTFSRSGADLNIGNGA